TSIILLTLLSSCSPIVYNNLDAFYQKANVDAMYATKDEVVANLVAISPNNPYLKWQGEGAEQRVLMATWTQYIDSYPVGETVELKWGETWVTACPELQDWYVKNQKQAKDMDLRVEQLLGLPPKSGKTHFIELWVKPSDMFRPSPDSEITDATTDLKLSKEVDSTHKEWYNGNIVYSYYPLAYPWTRLGYTYDWGNKKNHVGLSEFVIRKGATVIVNSVQTTADYLKK
ncbi:MAG: hypothetical protein AB8B69_18240, partial [Chitinophagales bacterium]